MKSKVIINRKSFSARVSLILIILAIPFIVVGKFSLLNNIGLNNIPLVTEVFIPIIGCLLFIISILLLGRIFFAFSFLPVVLCIIPIILQALKMGNIYGIIEVFICFLAVILYTCTVFGALQKKIFPAIVFIVEILYRLYFYIYKSVAAHVSFGVQGAFYHVAILFMLTSFLFAVFALDKKIKVVTSGKEVVPPIPGSNTLGEIRDPVYSDPAPDQGFDIGGEIDQHSNSQSAEEATDNSYSMENAVSNDKTEEKSEDTAKTDAAEKSDEKDASAEGI